jgi:hypothetical protein
VTRGAAILVLALVAPLARIERAAAAGSCGGGAHGGGGGGGGGGGAGWIDQAASTPACDEASDVVGFHRCRPFGAWARRSHVRFIFDGGLTLRQFDSLAVDQVGSVAHGGESFQFRVGTVSRSRPRETAALATFRGGVGLVHGLYVGAELGIGGLVRRAPTATEMMSAGTFGSPELAAQSSMIVESLAVAGVRGPVGPGTLGLELAGGARSVSYSYQSTYHDCVQITDVTSVGAIAEARARAELWLTPWLTAGATLGTSLLERGAWMGGMFVGVHTAAFDR